MAKSREQYEAEIRELEAQVNGETAMEVSKKLIALGEEIEETGDLSLMPVLQLCGDAIKGCAAWDKRVDW